MGLIAEVEQAIVGPAGDTWLSAGRTPWRLGLSAIAFAGCQLCCPTVGRQPLKEIGNWNTESDAKLVQPTGTDPVGAFLVFLHLLKCNAELVRYTLLSEMRCSPSLEHSLGYMLVNRC